MNTMASQITSLTIVYSSVYSATDQRKYQSSASLAFVRGIHRGTVNSPHKRPVTRKMSPFDDVIMICPYSPSNESKVPASRLLMAWVCNPWCHWCCCTQLLIHRAGNPPVICLLFVGVLCWLICSQTLVPTLLQVYVGNLRDLQNVKHLQINPNCMKTSLNSIEWDFHHYSKNCALTPILWLLWC